MRQEDPAEVDDTHTEDDRDVHYAAEDVQAMKTVMTKKMLGLLQADSVRPIRKQRARPKITSREDIRNTSDPSGAAKVIRDIRGYFPIKKAEQR